MRRKTLLAASTAAFALVGIQGAMAAPNGSWLFLNNTNEVIDDSGEFIIDVDQSGDLSDGDRIRAIYNFTFNTDIDVPTDSFDFGSAGFELTGMSDFTITSTTLISSTPIGGDITAFTLAPTAGFAAELAALGNVPFTAAELAGTGFALFTDPADNFGAPQVVCPPPTTQVACEALVLDGDFAAALGFGGDDDEHIFAQLTTGFGSGTTLGTLPLSTSTGFGNFDFSILQNLLFSDNLQVAEAAQIFGEGGDGLIDIAGSFDFDGAGANSIFTVTNQARATFFPVPEPTTVGLLGLGLIGIGWAGRRRRAA